MPAGRPKKPFIPWDGWQEEILGLYSEGASDIEIRVLLMERTHKEDYISKDLWYRWLEEEEEFSDTIKKGKIYSNAEWEKKGRINLENKDFSATLWYMNMKNRFGWRDKQEIDNKISGSLGSTTEAELDNKIKALQDKLNEQNSD